MDVTAFNRFTQLFRSSRHSILRSGLRKVVVCGRSIPSSVVTPPYIQKKRVVTPSVPLVHSIKTIEELRFAGGIVHQIFEELVLFLKPGLTTQDVDDFVFNACISKRVYPSPLGYCGFPKSVCTSVNEVACHGIPSTKQILRSGDLISIDISIFTGEVHGDACRSYVVGVSSDTIDTVRLKPSEYDPKTDRNRFLCAVAKACCDAGVALCAPGTPYTAIASAVSEVAATYACRVVPGIHGHGLADFLHGPPDIIHAIDELNSVMGDLPGTMQPGHVFTIEPCVALTGSQEATMDAQYFAPPCHPVVLEDGWTVITSDLSLTAQFEDTVLITSCGHTVLT